MQGNRIWKFLIPFLRQMPRQYSEMAPHPSSKEIFGRQRAIEKAVIFPMTAMADG
jgi:hypothetical protein